MRADAEMEEAAGRGRANGNRKMPDQVLCAVELQGPMLATGTAKSSPIFSAAGDQEGTAAGSGETRRDTGRRSRGRRIS